MSNIVRIGVVDGAITPELHYSTLPLTAKIFNRTIPNSLVNKRFQRSHADQVAEVIYGYTKNISIFSANVFGPSNATDVDVVIDALEWMADLRMDIVNLSFGTIQYNKKFENVCEKIRNSGSIIVCSSPARGNVVFPAAFDSCTAVTGDARCAPNELSYINNGTALFGAHPYIYANNPECGGGSSFAAARFTGYVSDLLSHGTRENTLIEEIKSSCVYFGPERKLYGKK
ncbi:MAG: S8 family serine peptidase [Dechloromonas sp.]|uniref:subtilisin-like serine protease QhpE n=1 Tax=Dechloromonas sp. TaxID=1917218 RepID=UPI0027F5D614|nr:S8 family serine peptidase [Dechloromonas sp.]MBT9519988.1 S8 family serine peptidase [Dechloromonas sp.]